MRYGILFALEHDDRPKGLLTQEVCGIPLIQHALSYRTLGKMDDFIVIGSESLDRQDDTTHWIESSQHEMVCQDLKRCVSLKGKKGKTMILNGYCPLISSDTLNRLFESESNITCVKVDAKQFKLYCLDNELLWDALEKVDDEIAVDDLIQSLSFQSQCVKTIEWQDDMEGLEVTSLHDVVSANQVYQRKLQDSFLNQGVLILDPKTTYLSAECRIGKGTVLYPNVHIKGKTKLGQQVIIKPNSWLENADVGNGSVIDSSTIVDSQVKQHCTIGPNAHLRLHTVVESNCRIGNYVEFKNVQFGRFSRCAHLTYLGDCVVGEDVNIGCGVVTVNYDGKNKHKTMIKDHAFVGSNSNLVAPITIGSYAVVAAGSTISQDVLDDEMVIERNMEIHKEGYGKAYITKEKREKK